LNRVFNVGGEGGGGDDDDDDDVVVVGDAVDSIGLEWHVWFGWHRSFSVGLVLDGRFLWGTVVRSHEAISLEGHAKAWFVWEINPSVLGEGLIWEETSEVRGDRVRLW